MDTRITVRYVDKYGDEWERVGDELTVTRLHDGNVGGWFNGKGLREVHLSNKDIEV